MKLREANVTNDSNSTLQNFSFKIGNEAKIIDFLRSNLYSDPIGSICREITCNARDAHREAGTPNKPIDITLPGTLAPILRIRDYGPGISPNRMDTVYRQYGVSTKRDSNDQVGAFGLGAKSPFAYTPQFTVTSITKIVTEEDCNHYRKAAKSTESDDNLIGLVMKCIYVAFVTADGRGGINLLSCNITDEQCGVEISIDVKRHDQHKFENNIAKWTAYWDVRPNILNRKEDEFYKDHTYSPILSGSNWKIYDCYRGSYNYYSDSYIKQIIIDGIPYPLDMSHFTENKSLNHISFDLFINTGEVNLSAGREALYYDSFTIKTIKSKLNNFFSEIESTLKNEIDMAKSYDEAAEVFANFYKNISVSIKLMFWRDNALYKSGINVDLSTDKNLRIYRYAYDGYKGKVVKSKMDSISFPKSLFIINDDGKFVPSAYMDNFWSLNSNYRDNKTNIYVISAADGDIKNTIKKFESDFKVKLSVFNTKNITEFKPKSAKVKVTRKKDEIDAYHNLCTKIKININDGGYYVVMPNLRTISLDEDDFNNNIRVANWYLHQLSVNTKAYGIHPNKIKRLDKTLWKSAKELLLQRKNEIEKECSIQEAWESGLILRELKYNFIRTLSEFELENVSKDILNFKSEINRLEKFRDLYDDIKNIYVLLNLYEDIKPTLTKIVPSHKVFKMHTDLINKYPLISYFDNYYVEDVEVFKKGIKEYIELVDSNFKI